MKKPNRILKPKDLKKYIEKTELEKLNEELKGHNKKQKINDLIMVFIVVIVVILIVFLLYL